jgi:drug/metabolite transporter (DMT)-like permease
MNQATVILFASLAGAAVLGALLMSPRIRERPPLVALLGILLLGALGGMMMTFLVVLAIGHLP